MIMKIGAIYFIITLNSFSFLNAELNLISSAIAFGLMTYPTKHTVRNATIGIRILLLMKSKKSRKLIPIGCTELSAPNPRDDGSAIAMA